MMKYFDFDFILNELFCIEGAYNECIHILKSTRARLQDINDLMHDCREIEELLEFNNQVIPLLQHASEKSNKLFELFRPISDIDFTKKEENKNCMEK